MHQKNHNEYSTVYLTIVLQFSTCTFIKFVFNIYCIHIFSTFVNVYFCVFSMLGIRPLKDALHYDMTKAALDMVTKQFAVELGCHQIRVNSVNPTFVDTERIRDVMKDAPEFERLIKQHTPMGRLCDIQECIDPVMYLLSDHSTMVTGTYNVVDGGLLSSLPF